MDVSVSNAKVLQHRALRMAAKVALELETMTSRRLSAFLDALASGRRPGSFRADPEDVEVLRTAITLRAARPGDGNPDEQFVAELYEHLADQAKANVVPITRPVDLRRGRAALAAVAASVVLVGGTAALTEALTPAAVVPAVVPAPTMTPYARQRSSLPTVGSWGRSSRIAGIRLGCS